MVIYRVFAQKNFKKFTINADQNFSGKSQTPKLTENIFSQKFFVSQPPENFSYFWQLFFEIMCFSFFSSRNRFFPPKGV